MAPWIMFIDSYEALIKVNPARPDRHGVSYGSYCFRREHHRTMPGDYRPVQQTAEELKGADPNGTVMRFSQLAHNVTDRTTVFLCIIER